jgi:hypothetical protein
VVARPALVSAVLAVTFAFAARSAPTAEYRIKAAFLLNFTHFVEWPAAAFTSPDAPLVICVVGIDPFGEALDQTVAGESIGQRRIAIRRLQTIADSRTCHVVYISRSESNRFDEVLDAVGAVAPVLSVSDIDGFASRGGTIGFYLDRNRVRFEIGPNTWERRHLKLSSQLLRLGRITP